MKHLAARYGLLFLLMALSSGALAQPPGIFSKTFSPDTIGAGSTARLQFILDFSDAFTPVTDLAFTDTLPAGVTIASPSGAFTDCSAAVLEAPAGGSTITFSGGSVGVLSTCTVELNVTSETVGTHSNVSGDLTSSLGNHGTAQDDLTVDPGRIGFSKSFSPASIPLGGTSTLTFELDNGGSETPAFNVGFSDLLPEGMLVAAPAFPVHDCSAGVLSTTSGSNTISFVSGFLQAGETCQISVDVTTESNGVFDNTSGELSTNAGSAGFATATLEVPLEFLTKVFVDDPAAPGGSVTLRFTLTNLNRNSAATEIAFDDVIDPMDTLTGVTPGEALPKAACGGMIDFDSLDNALFLSGASLAAAESCTFEVLLDIPASAADGDYANTTEPATATIGGGAETLNTATDYLTILPAPEFTKAFIDDPVAAGGEVTLEFTITNTDPDSTLTDISFTDELTTVLPVPISATLPPDGFCGVGSSMNLVPFDTDRQRLTMSGGALGPRGAGDDSCTFEVRLDVPAGMPTGTFTNMTSDINGVLDGTDEVVGLGASDDLQVVGAPTLLKEFIDDPVQAGGTATLQFTLAHSEEAPADATSIAFTDDLDAAMSGLVATGLPVNDICGTGSSLSGTDTLGFTGGSLIPGESCTFSVNVQVPAGAAPGSYTNTTSTLDTTVSGLAVSGNPATDNLQVAGVELTKEFIDDPVLPGATVDLRFTIENVSAASDATDIQFTDDLSATLSGLQATGLPMNDVCGVGSQISGTTNLVFTGGTLNVGESCNFTVTLDVPSGAVSDTYVNATSGFSATVEGSNVSFDNASDALVVDDRQLLFEKTFTDDPVIAGDTVNLRFSLTNQSGTQTVTDVSFTDDLDALLPGLAASGLPAADICGAGSQLSGTGVVTLTGGTIPAGGNCTFDVTLNLPASADAGAYINQTSEATGTLGGTPVVGGPAVDTLQINAVTLSKSFDGPSAASGTPVLTFELVNGNASQAVNQISFTDDLGAVLSGLVATGLPLSDVCGAGSSISGSTLLTFTGGSLSPGGSCTINVPLQVPAGAAPGSYTNTTSEVTVNGLIAGFEASADLQIEPPPVLTKSFAPDTILTGSNSTLVLTIDNSASAVAAQQLAVADNFPAGLTVASPANASTTCSGGTLTAVAGAASIGYTGGTVAAGASCSVQVDVTTLTAGVATNTTGDLTSSSGISGTASDDLTVTQAPVDRSFSGTLPSGETGEISFSSTDPGCTFATDPLFLDESSVSPPPPSTVELVDGVVSFEIESCFPGASVNVTVDYNQTLPPDTVYWKSGNPWFLLPASVAGTTVSFSVTDGGPGDADGQANGTIVDPSGAGFALPPEPIPASGRMGVGILVLLLALGGAAVVRMRALSV